jgi:hypothetical protein
MAVLTIKVRLAVPRKVSKEDWRAVVLEQIEECIPDTVYYETEDGEEHEMTVEVGNL